MAHFINCISCGKQYNKDVFDKCPFCGSLQIIPQKTAEEIINEHKHKEELVKEQNEEILKDAVRKRYNVAGDISEEQFKQLLAIYEQENGNRILPQQNDDSPILKRNKWTIPIILSTLVMFIIIIIGISSGNSNKASKIIRTADQWVTYCDSEPNIHQCLKAFDKIDLTTQCRIYDDLAYMVANLTKYDEKGRIKADAYGYIWIYMVRYEKGKLLGEELKKTGIADKMNTNYATMILTERRFRELIDQWENE